MQRCREQEDLLALMYLAPRLPHPNVLFLARSCSSNPRTILRLPSLQRVVPERQVSSASSSVSGGSSSNSSSGSSVGRQHRSFFVARGPPDEHLPVAVEHRWPEALSTGGLHFSGIRGPGSFVASARNLGQQGGGCAANDPIIIDDPSPSSACSMQGGLQVVVLSDDSD